MFLHDKTGCISTLQLFAGFNSVDCVCTAELSSLPIDMAHREISTLRLLAKKKKPPYR